MTCWLLIPDDPMSRPLLSQGALGRCLHTRCHPGMGGGIHSENAPMFDESDYIIVCPACETAVRQRYTDKDEGYVVVCEDRGRCEWEGIGTRLRDVPPLPLMLNGSYPHFYGI